MNVLQAIRDVGVSGLLDMTVMALVLYSVLVWFRRTRAVFVVLGMFITGAFYLVARQVGMSLTTSVLQGFFAVIVFAVIVIFQEEIRHFFEKVASPRWPRRFPFRRAPAVPAPEVEILARTAQDLARQRIGALIALQGQDPMARHLVGGVDLDGQVSEPLLKSIFDPHSPGHDGAVLIDGGRVVQFGAHLPLSHDLAQLQGVGTRHAAALGLSERCDALCIVVSEERGSITIARRGQLSVQRDAEHLVETLAAFRREMAPQVAPAFWKGLIRRNLREKLIAILFTPLLWFFLVHESKLVYQSYRVPIECEAPPRARIVEVSPPDAEVTLLGPRRAFYLIGAGQIRLSVPPGEAREGAFLRTVTAVYESLPEGVVVHGIAPEVVQIRLEPTE